MGGACRGKEWYPNVRGFTQLKLLLIEYSFLKYWKATNDNFPALERLVLKECSYLKEIPIEFAEIPTLQLIELTRCLSELGKSAARIQQEQEDLGNNPVDVRISRPFIDLVITLHYFLSQYSLKLCNLQLVNTGKNFSLFVNKFEKSNVSTEMTDFGSQIKDVANVIEHTIQLRVTEVMNEAIDRVQKESPKIRAKGKQASSKSLVQDSSSTEGIPNIKNVIWN
ncbi:hypothetical protein CQW23_06667 [Capsicum baccatum]|uniref:NB-ARC domain-containing protein n=1 Tax=Capsicum baccatum TaxID=33114 RepID=A0A2G2X3Y6_CAPBA|nr:hypothetical protein CQW23_06667 [Capsicum baccatum]